MGRLEDGNRRGRRLVVHRGEELRCSWRFEEEAWGQGFRTVAGVDEVGRGALCGPVVVGVVILAAGTDWTGIDDSKRLTRRQRESFSERIRAEARGWAIGVAESSEIDRLNILEATYLAMRRAVETLSLVPEYVLVDGSMMPHLKVPGRAIVKGDAQSVSIAAGSIIAKVARDGMMREWDERCPGYGLARNMGYGSRDHCDALHRLGPSPIHRRSFQGTQPWLF
jgi:ribonuclease HII